MTLLSAADFEAYAGGFVETARALGCEEDEAAFDGNLKAIAPPKAKAALAPSKRGKDG